MLDAAVLPFTRPSRRTSLLRWPRDLIEVLVAHPIADVAILRVAGEIDMLTAPVLRDCVLDVLTGDPAVLVLDLGRIRFFGASGIATLLATIEGCRRAGVGFHLAHPSPAVRTTLDLVRLGHLF